MQEVDRTADGIRSDGGRNPIGRRTESDWTADGIRLDGGRNPIGRRTESDDKSCGFGQRKLRGCIIYLKCVGVIGVEKGLILSAKICTL